MSALSGACRTAVYLCVRQPSLGLVCEVEPATDPAVLLQAFSHAEKSRDEEAGVIERHQNLGAPVTNDGINKVVKPVVWKERVKTKESCCAET